VANGITKTTKTKATALGSNGSAYPVVNGTIERKMSDQTESIRRAITGNPCR
jgi:hypothetical protein